MNHRVVVTGIGCVTPLGRDVESTWRGLLDMKSGVGPISHFDATGFPTTFASEVKDFDLASYIGEDASRFEKCGRNIKFALGAASQALSDSGVADNGIDRSEIDYTSRDVILDEEDALRLGIANRPFEELKSVRPFGRATNIVVKDPTLAPAANRP